MFAWIAENLATIIICLVLAVIVAAIIIGLVRNKKKRQILLWLQLCPLCNGGLLPQQEVITSPGRRSQKSVCASPFSAGG